MRGARRPIRWIVALIAIVAVVGGLLVDRWVRAHVDSVVRAGWRMRAGDRVEAERLLWGALHDHPVTPTLVLVFLDNHEALGGRVSVEEDEGQPGADEPRLAPQPRVETIDELAILRFLVHEAPHDAKVVGLFRIGLDVEEIDEDVREEIAARAADDPPMPWANHLVALERDRDGDWRGALDYYIREGTAYPEHAFDVDAALYDLEEARDWDALGARLSDPRVAAVASPWFELRWSLHTRNIGKALRASIASSYRAPDAGPLVLAVVAALAWFVFCAWVGRANERPWFRIPLYLVALALGAASIAPTTFLMAVQATYLHLVPNGTPGRDLVFYVLGVGLREELSKLLMFAPLLFVLRKRGTPLDVVVCGALVGLGFALVENLEYFARGSLPTAMARFLTANFLHMAMTAVTAHALDDVVRAKEDRSFDASRTVLLVVLMHGLYDFFLTSHVVERASFASMLVFFMLTRWFVRLLVDASPPRARRAPVLGVFALGTSTVVGTSFVYGCVLAGPAHAALAMLEGLLGVAIVVIIFVRELRAL